MNVKEIVTQSGRLYACVIWREEKRVWDGVWPKNRYAVGGLQYWK